MSYLKITNVNEIGIGALILMGASTKQDDDAKIGFFGSGNKYALATLLRAGIGITIYAGNKLFSISTKTIAFRSQHFEQIFINDVSTSLTTSVGPNWEVWMAIRELICNAIDEGECSWSIVEDITPAPDGYTTVYLDYTTEVSNVITHISEYINDKDPIVSVSTGYGYVDILEGTEGRIFRKNIACFPNDMPSLFHYNFHDVPINESRLVEHSHQVYERIACALAATDNEDIIRAYIEHRSSKLLENNVYWNSIYCTSTLSSTWKKVLDSYDKELIADLLLPLIAEEEREGLLPMPSGFITKVQCDFPSYHIYGNENTDSVMAIPSNDLRSKVNSAVEEIIGWGIEIPFNILYCKFLDDTQNIKVDKTNCYISVDTTEDITALLYQEIVTKSSGCAKYTRGYQQYIIANFIAAKRAMIQGDFS